ncbi:MAG TPA: hypothetical protein VGS22_15990 [Thermoanaerobaculia bacterium]|jgi:hypothetical protein|nr:hypothetical protein [Thermoanaerobaculia bacterium]
MSEPAKARFWRLFPLALLAAMLVIALGIEAFRYGAVLWLPKLPLAVILLWALLRPRRAGT